MSALLLDALRKHGARAALVTPGRDGAADRVVTSDALLERAALAADGLRALGVRTGEPVLLWSENREPWLVADLALLALGCPDVPRGTEAPADEIAYIVEKVRARVAFLERPELLKKLGARAPSIEIAILLTGNAGEAPRGMKVISFDELIASADAQQARARFEAAVAARRRDEVATIVFTSGTTGRPKGVVLTQENLASNLEQVLEVIGFLRPGASLLSILPSWHMFERMVEYALLALGLQIVYSDRRHFARDLAQRRPEVLAAVPRLWLMLMEGVQTKVAVASERKRRLVQFAIALAEERERPRRFAGAPRTLRSRLLAPLDALLRRLVLSKIARALGVDRLRDSIAISGGGTLPDHVDLFFASLGIELVNGYGLTETSPVLTLRRPWRNVGGTVGPPLAHTEIEVRDPATGAPVAPGTRGEIHVRGPQIMRGYFEDPAATALVVGHDGWFDTGDLGTLQPDGTLAITGRAKETIVLLSGENVEPEPLENALTSSPLIEQAVVVGQDQKHLAALLVLRQREGAVLPSGPALQDALRREIDARVGPKNGFRGHERIVRFRLLDKALSVEDGFLSQTLKVKRSVVHERLHAEIAALFDER